MENRVISHPPEAVLTIEDEAAWLRISKRMVERLRLPCVYLGTRTRRFTGRTILEYLAKKEAA